MSMQSFTVIYFGDSITEGQGVHHSLIWTTLITEKLRLAVSEIISPSKQCYLNFGVPGETTRQALDRFPKLAQQHRPDLMTIQFGLNDCKYRDVEQSSPRVSESAYRSYLIELIDRARRCDIRKIILSTNHPTLRHQPTTYGSSFEARRMKYNDIVRDVAQEKNVSLCDIDLSFMRAGIPLSELVLPEPDMLHLSSVGHELYAATIEEPLIALAEDLLAATQI